MILLFPVFGGFSLPFFNPPLQLLVGLKHVYREGGTVEGIALIAAWITRVCVCVCVRVCMCAHVRERESGYQSSGKV